MVVLDLMMPVMDGAATFRELRRLKPELPVLFASGYSAKDVLDRLDGESPDGFSQKRRRNSALISPPACRLSPTP